MHQKTADLLIVRAVICGAAIYSSLHGSKSYEEEIENLNIKSVVRKKYIDYENHGTTYVVFENDSIVIYREWEAQISVGDSIIKTEGSQVMTIKNLNKNIDFNFQNPNRFSAP